MMVTTGDILVVADRVNCVFILLRYYSSFKQNVSILIKECFVIYYDRPM